MTDDTECKGKPGHKLCPTCQKYKPRSESPNRFLAPPCRNLNSCSFYDKVK